MYGPGNVLLVEILVVPVGADRLVGHTAEHNGFVG